jgi:D-sedoheptulose 7-phosphate isomerase
MSEDLIRAQIEASLDVTRRLLEEPHVAFTRDLADLLAGALREGGKAIFCGNGGSAADATHLAAELVGRFRADRPPLAALSLSDNASSLTAIGNDYAYSQTFARQVRGLGCEGDVLVAMSTSGESENVVAAIEAAREIGMSTAGFTGTPGGRLATLVDLCLCVPSADTPRIQESHMLIAHVACELVERSLFPDA